MSAPYRSLVLSTDVLGPLVDIPAIAQAAGFYRVWTTEFQGRDAIVRATAAGLATSTLKVGTGIAYAFTRAPRALAAAALDAQELTHGRFTLGLGAGTRGLRRGYGIEDFDPPATRLADVCEQLRVAWAETTWQRSLPPPLLAAGGVNETMIAVAARHVDRVLLHPLCLINEHLDQRILPGITRGQARRVSGQVKVSAWCITSVDADSHIAQARARRQLAFYLSTPGYRAALDGTQWKSVAEDIRSGFAQGLRNWDTLAQNIPDELLDQVSIHGDVSAVCVAADRMSQRLGEIGIDEMVFQCVDAGPRAEDVVEGLRITIDTLKPFIRADLGGPL
jgi:alkanesulfonate monooxygenase SsuD/methylene tetrahydromethanopterin reductase-like flavin-dependent oxidoreductase (luciferase family)